MTSIDPCMRSCSTWKLLSIFNSSLAQFSLHGCTGTSGDDNVQVTESGAAAAVDVQMSDADVNPEHVHSGKCHHVAKLSTLHTFELM